MKPENWYQMRRDRKSIFFVAAALGVAAALLNTHLDGSELPGIIALKSGNEVYLPDPVLLIHGIASNINTYGLALPKLNAMFRVNGVLKYDFDEVSDNSLESFPHPDTVGDALVLQSPIAGFDYRERTGNGDKNESAVDIQTYAGNNSPGVATLPNAFGSKLSLTNTIRQIFYGNGGIFGQITPVEGESEPKFKEHRHDRWE